ncbi:MAG: acyl--CoA ligase [Desulfobacterales bacterium]|nr:acyl--CoA ligase [Desulfobacterales bacterium]
MIITEILARNYRLYKNKTALIERSPAENTRRSITWEQFYKESNKLANGLLKLGVKKGDKIVHLMMNSIEWLPIYFGILSTGAWAVPLNFRFEAEKIFLCTKVAQPKVFIFGEEFIERIESIKESLDQLESAIETWIFVGDSKKCPDFAFNYFDFIENLPESEPGNINIAIEDEAALYFTSGTTGVPKAVLLTHRNLEHACYVENNHHKQTHDDIFLLMPPLYHTGAKMHWFGSFIVGGKCVLLKGIKPKWILEVISEEKVTITWLLVPWAHDLLIAIEARKVELSDYKLDQWWLMHAGAQPVSPALIREWKTYFPNHSYDTNYGLTESTGPGCVHLGLENSDNVGPIGVPGFDWECQVVDKQGNMLPWGETGELIVKGPGVMKEYYKNPEETNKALKNGWLFTGDMARYDRKGFIWLVDRLKDLIIYGGENIFPNEIENYFMEHKKIKDIAVIGIPDKRLGEVPAAIVEVKQGMELTKQEIMEFGKNLPKYKRPKKIFFDKIPRNPTGKIEKPKLRRLYAKDERKDITKLFE